MNAMGPRPIDGPLLLSIGILDQMLDEAAQVETLPEARAHIAKAKRYLATMIDAEPAEPASIMDHRREPTLSDRP
jgi:hypothetical protein